MSMKYFVSIENTFYHRWQAELLIESFNMFGLQDDLVVAVAETKNGVNGYFRNLNKHQNKFPHENVGRANKCLPLNKLYSLATAVTQDRLGDTFAVLHPDMVLHQPIKVDPQENHLIFHSNSKSWKGDQVAQEFVRAAGHTWVPLGETMVFQKVPHSFVTQAYLEGLALAAKVPYKSEIEREAWMLSAILHQRIEKCPRFVSTALEMDLMHSHPALVLHYSQGFPPHFHKKNYQHDRAAIYFTDEPDPLKAMVKRDPTPATRWLKGVVDSYVAGGDHPVADKVEPTPEPAAKKPPEAEDEE